MGSACSGSTKKNSKNDQKGDGIYIYIYICIYIYT